jgi:hypothetical protein
MKAYTLKLYGWELDGSAHWLSNEEVNDIYDYMEEEFYEDLDDMGMDIETFYKDEKNSFYVSTLQYTDRSHFVLENEQGVEVLEFGNDDLGDTPDEYDDYTIYGAYPTPGYTPEDNVIIDLYENKGLVCECVFTISDDEEPVASDFSMAYDEIETPDGDYSVLGAVFYKGKKLTISYDESNTRGKGRTVEIFRGEDC